MRNNAAVKKLANTIDETQQIQQELVSAVGALKENVEDMKEDFVSMTMEMTQIKTRISRMKDTGEELKCKHFVCSKKFTNI